ncbi:MAG: chloride channel protein [Gammaproteobacteria bacterium]|nr:chloride channel protein [Gammaproteobacteria bacterium]
MPLKPLADRWSDRLDETRIRLARSDALLHLAALGLVTGLLAGAVIVLFRLFVEGLQDLMLPGQGAENYEALPLWGRWLLPLVAAVLLAIMFRWFARGIHMLGIARVLERMAFHQGECTPRAFLLQFFGAAIAIMGGHSVGREGPHVFLGASAGSLLGQRLGVPHNVTRLLVGCGTAAGIAASFNTPLAGVVFALEVVMMEYTVASFIPVILAAVSATTLSRLVFGDHPAFSMPAMELGSLYELGVVLLLGMAAGTLSALFNQSVQSIARRTRGVDIWWRMLIAGFAMALFGSALPGVMGIGYDSVDVALNGGFMIGMLALLMIGKLLATSVCIGLGVPGGMIGPVLFIGAMLGALLAELTAMTPLGLQTPVGLFALLGMGAMMAGSLQAPLAALMAMLELTDNPEIILPGMLAVVVSGITASEVFGKQSLFVTMLKANGLDVRANPVSQALRRVGVASVMERDFKQVGDTLSWGRAQEILAQNPSFLVIDRSDAGMLVMPAVELARHVETAELYDPTEAIDLLSIPAQRLDAATIELQANLHEAWEAFREHGVGALVVRRMTAPGIYRLYGVLTPGRVEKTYRV